MTDDPFARIRDLIAEGATEDGAVLLRTVIEGMVPADELARARIRDLQQDIVVQLGSIAMLRKGLRRAELSLEDYERRIKSLNFALLDIVDDAKRVAARADVIAAALMPSATITAQPPAASKLEKVWGRNNLQDLSWLERGIIASRAVCRVVSPEGIGTGFLIGDNRVVTNNHVVSRATAAFETRLEFNFEQDASGQMKPISSYGISSDPNDFMTSPVSALDCTIMRVVETGEAPPLAQWGALTIARASVEIGIGDPVTIIQHPNGGQKKIAVTANEVVNLFDQRLHYMTDTLPGSSGSPVFNEKWQVIALHHAGGDMVKNARGERFFANEGILLNAIRKDAGFTRAFSAES